MLTFGDRGRVPLQPPVIMLHTARCYESNPRASSLLVPNCLSGAVCVVEKCTLRGNRE